jgi:hypothetical protein
MAFSIGAVPPQSVLKCVYHPLTCALFIPYFSGTYPPQPTFNATPNSVAAAYIVWAEMELDVQYSFGMANTSEPDYVAYIAPVPLHLSTTTSARWLTDVVGINPTCSWASTNFTGTAPVQIPANSTSFNTTAYLLDFDLNVEVSSLDMRELHKFDFWFFLFLRTNGLSSSSDKWEYFCHCQRPHLCCDQPYYTHLRLRRFNGVSSGSVSIWLPFRLTCRHHTRPDGLKYFLYDCFD